MLTSTPTSTLANELTDLWSTPLPAPPRTHLPPSPTVATLLERDGSGWRRTRLTASQVTTAGVQVLDGWHELDLASGLYDRGVVVRDVRP